MLYISRCLPDDKYGVVDTDDNTETIVAREGLIDIVCFMGIEIAGVQTYEWNGSKMLDTITPYQDLKHGSGKLAKARMLLGVDIHVYDGEITFIAIDIDKYPIERGLVLSEYGNRMNWNIEVRLEGRHPIGVFPTLVIDDNIQLIGSGPNNQWKRNTAKWDIRKLTNRDYRLKLYRFWLGAGWGVTYDPIGKLIVDDEATSLYWKRITMLYTPSRTTRLWEQELSVDLDNNPKYELSPEEKADFLEIVNSIEHCGVYGFTGLTQVICPSWETMHGLFTLADYKWLTRNFLNLFNYLEPAFPHNRNREQYNLNRLKFRTYFKYFEASVDMQKMFVQMCNSCVKRVCELQGEKCPMCRLEPITEEQIGSQARPCVRFAQKYSFPVSAK